VVGNEDNFGSTGSAITYCFEKVNHIDIYRKEKNNMVLSLH